MPVSVMAVTALSVEIDMVLFKTFYFYSLRPYATGIGQIHRRKLACHLK